MTAFPLFALASMVFAISFCGLAASCSDIRRLVVFLVLQAAASAAGFAASGSCLDLALLALLVGGAFGLAGLGLLALQPQNPENGGRVWPWNS